MILNLTQHAATDDQIAAGVVNLLPEPRARLQELLSVPEDDLRSPILGNHLDIRAMEICRTIWPIVCDYTAIRVEELASLKAEGNRAALGELYGRPLLQAMVGGMPPLVDRLVRELKRAGVEPLYALTGRASKEEALPDGTTRKTSVFRHVGFIPA